MKLRIIGYDEMTHSHRAVIEGEPKVSSPRTGDTIYVDVQVDGGLGIVENCALIGRTIECKSIHGYVYIADFVGPFDNSE